jgi:hypothetical protein
VTALMLALWNFFIALPGHVADVATSPFGRTAGGILGTAALILFVNAVVIPARERRADRRAARRNR